jgi:uncharacterized protein (DUF2336 family)
LEAVLGALSQDSLITEVEQAIGSGSDSGRVEMLRRVTDLFIGHAETLQDDGIDLFDDVIGRLSTVMEEAVRAELANRLAPVANAPKNVMKSLAGDDSIKVAAPVLAQSTRLDDADLVEIANSKGQEHLLALSTRKSLSEIVTDILVERGNNKVVHSVASNQGARLSERSFSTIIVKAETDDLLAGAVGLRQDISPTHLEQLLRKASDVAREKLMAAMPNRGGAIGDILAKLADELNKKRMLDYEPARKLVAQMQRQGQLGEEQVGNFANAGNFLETVAALSAISGIPIQRVERALRDSRPDMLFMVVKAIGFKWHTAKSVYLLQSEWRRVSQEELDTARRGFLQLQAATAQRIVAFLKAREAISKRS